MKLFLIMLLTLSWNELKATEITYIGTTNLGMDLSHSMDEKAYERHLSESLTVLDATVEQQTAKETVISGRKFRLSKIVLGLGASGEIGIGPFKLGTGIRHCSFYTRSL